LNLPSRQKGAVQNEEHWKALYAQASPEQDPEKLDELVQEINRLLDAKRERSLAAPRKCSLSSGGTTSPAVIIGGCQAL
jgi:asparagine synthetase B (glutamine-hydrolysing)